MFSAIKVDSLNEFHPIGNFRLIIYQLTENAFLHQRSGPNSPKFKSQETMEALYSYLANNVIS